MFDPATRQLETVAWLQRARWYASVATLADGNLLVVGGMQQVGGYKVVLLTDVMSQLSPTQSPCRHCHLTCVTHGSTGRRAGVAAQMRSWAAVCHVPSVPFTARA